jgi:hypothetical protein
MGFQGLDESSKEVVGDLKEIETTSVDIIEIVSESEEEKVPHQ